MKRAGEALDTSTIDLDIRSSLLTIRYDMRMGKRTSLIMEPKLLDEAARILGTKGATATVREALERVVRQQRLESLARWEFPEDALERLAEMRQPRKLDFE
jgi:Arc/MetJ family transcription regulator